MSRAAFYFKAEDGRDPIIFESEGAVKKLWSRVLVVLRNPQLRPIEIWLIRAAVALVTAQLGIDATHIAK